MANHFYWRGSDLLLQVRVSPKASRDHVGEVMGTRLKIAITAQPTDGKANRHLTKMLAKRFRVSGSEVIVVAGHTQRDKTICIQAPKRLPEEFQLEQP